MIAKYRAGTLVLEVLLWLIAAVLYLLPLTIMINVALRPRTDQSNLLSLPSSITFENFVAAWVDGKLASAFLVSIVVTVVSVAGIVVFSAAAAYPIARSSRRWSRLAFGFFVAGLIIPGIGGVTLYVTMRDISLLGSPVALVLIYIGSGMPLSILLYTVFMRALPREYEEAARVDGASTTTLFWRVVFPLVRPVTGTIVILQIVTVYNDFFQPLLYLAGSGYQTIPLALQTFRSQYYTDWGAIFAGLLLALVPVLIAYLFLQERIIKGFAGGLKG